MSGPPQRPGSARDERRSRALPPMRDAPGDGSPRTRTFPPVFRGPPA